jgi:hypothetical protein
VREAVDFSISWLSSHGDHQEEASFVLKALYQQIKGLTDVQQQSLVQAMTVWLQSHWPSKGADFVLNRVLRNKKTPKACWQDVAPYAWQALSDPRWPDVGSTAHALLSRPECLTNDQERSLIWTFLEAVARADNRTLSLNLTKRSMFKSPVSQTEVSPVSEPEPGLVYLLWYGTVHWSDLSYFYNKNWLSWALVHVHRAGSACAVRVCEALVVRYFLASWGDDKACAAFVRACQDHAAQVGLKIDPILACLRLRAWDR